MVQTIPNKHDDGMKIVDSRNKKDYSRSSISYFTCNSIDLTSSNSAINDYIEYNVSGDRVGFSSRQKEKMALLFLYYLFVLASSIGFQETTVYNTYTQNAINYILWMSWVKEYDKTWLGIGKPLYYDSVISSLPKLTSTNSLKLRIANISKTKVMRELLQRYDNKISSVQATIRLVLIKIIIGWNVLNVTEKLDIFMNKAYIRLNQWLNIGKLIILLKRKLKTAV